MEVCSTTPLEDYELGTVLAHGGRQMVDKHTALQYVRARQVTTEVNGDYGRTSKRQQLFLSSLLRSLISADTFFSPSSPPTSSTCSSRTAMSTNIRPRPVDLGQSIQGVNAGRISFITVRPAPPA